MPPRQRTQTKRAEESAQQATKPRKSAQVRESGNTPKASEVSAALFPQPGTVALVPAVTVENNDQPSSLRDALDGSSPEKEAAEGNEGEGHSTPISVSDDELPEVGLGKNPTEQQHLEDRARDLTSFTSLEHPTVVRDFIRLRVEHADHFQARKGRSSGRKKEEPYYVIVDEFAHRYPLLEYGPKDPKEVLYVKWQNLQATTSKIHAKLNAQTGQAGREVVLSRMKFTFFEEMNEANSVLGKGDGSLKTVHGSWDASGAQKRSRTYMPFDDDEAQRVTGDGESSSARDVPQPAAPTSISITPTKHKRVKPDIDELSKVFATAADASAQMLGKALSNIGGSSSKDDRDRITYLETKMEDIDSKLDKLLGALTKKD